MLLSSDWLMVMFYQSIKTRVASESEAWKHWRIEYWAEK